jgi:hypothetical protein
MTREYLIRPNESEWFDLHKDNFSEVFRPINFESEPITGWGDHRIKIEGIEISFSYEDPGIQITFWGEVDGEIADQIVDEILKNIEKSTEQSGSVVLLS